MPKYGIHQIVLQDTIQRLTGPDTPPEAKAAGELLRDHPFEAALGAVGPDLLFFGVDYGIMGAINIFMPVLDWMDAVESAIDEIMEPIEEIEDRLEDFVDDTLDAVGLGVVNEVKERLDRIDRLMGEIPAMAVGAGLLKGLEPLAATTLPGGQATSRIGRHARELFENYLIPPSQMNADEVDWYWFDMLHYRETGAFARRLVAGATSDAQRAYALAYLTHIGTDLVGHPFVNQISGGPFRLGVQRHVTAENYMDVAAYRARGREPVYERLAADLHMKGDDHPQMPDELAELVARALRETYEGTAHPRRLPGDGMCTSEDVRDAYVMFRRIVQRLGDSRIERLRPQPVTGSIEQDVADVMDAIAAVDPPPDPPSLLPPDPGIDWESLFDGSATLEDLAAALADTGSSLQEWFDAWSGAMAETAAWAVETAQQVASVARAMIELGVNTPVRPLLVLLHAAELALYDMFRTMHAVFARTGLVYPLVDDLDDGISRSLWTVGDPFRHVVPPASGSVIARRSGYPMLREKGQSHLVAPLYQPEQRTTCAAFHRPEPGAGPGGGVTPEAFMTQEPFDPKALMAYATAGDRDRRAELWAEGTRIGNAADLCAWMIQTAVTEPSPEQLDIAFTDWNLDGDRGYGARTWTAILPHNWSADAMAKMAIVTGDPPDSATDTSFTAPDGTSLQAAADGTLSAGDALHGLAIATEVIPGGVVFGANPAIFDDPQNDMKFGMIKAKQEEHVSRRTVEEMRIANLLVSESAVPDAFARYEQRDPGAWSGLLAPRLRVVQGAGVAGNVYHINGVGTPAYDALYERHAVERFLNLSSSGPDLNVRLLYNVSDPRLPIATMGSNLLASDIFLQAEIISVLDAIQAASDKVWNFTLLGRALGASTATAVRTALAGGSATPAASGFQPPLPIRNATTVAVIALLHDALQADEPIVLSGYSHGTQIIFNAVAAFALRGDTERTFVADRVQLAFFGRMVDTGSVGFLRGLVASLTDYTNPGDPASDLLGNLPPDPMFLDAMSTVDIRLSLTDVTVQFAVAEFADAIQAEQHQFYRYAPRIRLDSPRLRDVLLA